MAGGGRRRTRPGPRRGPRDRGDPCGCRVRGRTARITHPRALLHVVPSVAHLSLQRGPAAGLRFPPVRRPLHHRVVASTDARLSSAAPRTSNGASMAKDVYDVGEIPPVGEVPPRMHAQLVRPERYGDPKDAIRDEVIDVPPIGPDEALVMVMAAGVNFNNVWAARGVPVDVTKTQARWGEPTDFHIVGSDAAGVVYAVGERVTNVRVGDRVVVHAGQWDLEDPWVTAGRDPGLAPSFRVWGYDTCWGSFAQFTKVQAHQCLPKAEPLSWEAAAAPTLAGARAVAVVSSADRGAFAVEQGAVGFIDRTAFDHWGTPPAWDAPEWKTWFEGAKGFGKAIWDVVGERTNPTIVFEHPGQDTIPTSIFVCERGGMVVICAGTTGYDTMV